MAMSSVRELMDRLNAEKAAATGRLTIAAAATVTPTNPLGLRFDVGARVLDVVTGQWGTVKAGARDSDPGVEVYRVSFDNGDLRFCTNRHLEPAPTSAAAAS